MILTSHKERVGICWLLHPGPVANRLLVCDYKHDQSNLGNQIMISTLFTAAEGFYPEGFNIPRVEINGLTDFHKLLPPNSETIYEIDDVTLDIIVSNMSYFDIDPVHLVGVPGVEVSPMFASIMSGFPVVTLESIKSFVSDNKEHDPTSTGGIKVSELVKLSVEDDYAENQADDTVEDDDILRAP
jgi:hypothetical protein